MAKSEQLREQHKDMQLNTTSKKEDKLLESVVEQVHRQIGKDFGVTIESKKRLYIKELVQHLKEVCPSEPFAEPESKNSFISPDGGILYLVDKEKKRYPILISEVKNQGTNDRRKAEGLKKQAKGNAIERLGKNVIALRAYMSNEGIFPFVCFGDGCDFEKGSSILDRVHAIALFGELNTDHTINEGPNGMFNRGSYYFRHQAWTAEEMYDRLMGVAKKSIRYYFDKYGEDNFR